MRTITACTWRRQLIVGGVSTFALGTPQLAGFASNAMAMNLPAVSKLVGETIDFVYEDETYRIEILTDTTLRWTKVAGSEGIGESDKEKYIYRTRSSQEIVLVWAEASGLGLTNIFRLKEEATLSTYATTKDRQVFENLGSIKLPT